MRVVRARGGGAGLGAWRRGGAGHGVVAAGLVGSRPRLACLRARGRKARGGRSVRRCAAAASSTRAIMDRCLVRHSGKFPNASIAPLRSDRQCKPLWLLEMATLKEFFAKAN